MREARLRNERMADIFVSYTASDSNWAFWIAHELKALGHVAHVADWELGAGANIIEWMEERHHAADHILLVVSQEYLKKPYSSFESRAAQWATALSKTALPVLVEPCRLPTGLASLRRCELYGVSEEEASSRLRAFLAPARAPSERPRFPGESEHTSKSEKTSEASSFPGRLRALTNVPISPPRHFLGRDDALAAIEKALSEKAGRAAIVALQGLRGVGKSTVAAAYAEQHRYDYRVTWWIRAQNEPEVRAGLVALGLRLHWISTEDREEPAVAKVIERLRDDGHGILLIFDSANDAATLRPYLPHRGRTHALVTTNAHAWRAIAELIEIKLWPKEVGADYLIARSDRVGERAAADALSDALGGLPLAYEQAAAYCERLDISFRDYRKRFERAPAQFLDDARHAPVEYHDGLTVAKTFSLAIDEAAKLHPAAEPLIVHAALLAPEPIPLFLFAAGQAKFSEPLASELADHGIDEAVTALQAFALVDREAIVDERDPAISTDCIRLHRLVRQIAAARLQGDARVDALRRLIAVVAKSYPGEVNDDAAAWPRARRLDAIALAVVGADTTPPPGSESDACYLLDRLADYRHFSLASYDEARALHERSLSIREKVFGPEHPGTAQSLNNLALLLEDQGDLAGARPLLERALSIREKVLGPEHLGTAQSLNNLALLLEGLRDLSGARPLLERALAIREKVLGPEHPSTAASLNNVASLLRDQGDLSGARPLLERALAIREKVLGPEHPSTAASLNNVASVLRDQGDLAGARPLLERALSIREKVLGPEHPQTATALNDLAYTLQEQGNLAEARLLYERALAICEKVFGGDHPLTASISRNLAVLLASENAGASAPSERRLAIERLTSSGRDPMTREILAKMLASDSDSGIRCFIVEKLAEFWPDQQTEDTLIVTVENDDSADVRASCLELLSRISWKSQRVRQFLRSRVDAETGPIRERLLHAVVSAGTRISNFWEGKLSGARDADEEPEMLPGYPAFRIAQFRLRDIGPIRDSGVVRLAREVNIFLGDNAAGKTTILRALGLAMIGHAAANEVEDKPIAYLRKGAEVGTIEVLFELVSDPGALSEELGYFAVGLQIASGSSRFGPTPDSEMSLIRPGQSTRPLPNSAEALGALRSAWPSQFGFVCGYGAVRTFSESRFSIQPEAQKSENEWVLSLFRYDAWLVNPEVFAKLVRGDTSNIAGAPTGGLPATLTDVMRTSLKCLLPDVTEFFSHGENDLQVSGTSLRFSELSEGYRSLLAMLGHMLRCLLKARDWTDNPCQIDGVTLIDELDLHLHPNWQGHVVQDFRKAFGKLQLIASTHSPLVVRALKRHDVFILERDTEGYTTIRQPEIDPQGLGVGGILTSIFALGSTIDQPTLDKISRRLLLHARRESWNDDERREYEELTGHLGRLGFTRELSDPYFDRFAAAMARRHKATVVKLSEQEKRELDAYADQLLSELSEGGVK